ncbi:HEAT repeat domain-containing protein [Aureliella helgolandensis]|uniref:HEAT repeat protein n=1 Tax=Aureliella helgolandensis TaxID=2527968 RepID=A0A518G822_9BACT|nr:HEAT repeat domain-containing protein [Aureliella helgolandensis]QDV24735.1 hypothetical protein Q31a_30560 [Aureliella helgolandensis]
MAHDDWIRSTCNWLRSANEEDSSPEATLARVAHAPPAELEALLEVLAADFHALAQQSGRVKLLMQAVAARMVQLTADAQFTREGIFINAECLARLYDQLVEVDAAAASHVLQILASQGDEESLSSLASLIAETPPEDWQSVGLALSPLWNAEPEALEQFFDCLDAGFVHPATMAVLLDLANFAVRSGKLSEHPWAARSSELGNLLAAVTAQLEKLEQDPAQFGSQIEEIQRTLNDSVALVISLCDSLGLIANAEAIPTLTHTMQLSHRRIQTEAAGALARLGDESGQQRLVELAADPVARRRAVAYAEELEFAEQIEEPLRLPHALAESELASWLAEPPQYGIPPTGLELIDTRTQYWPGYEEPRDCYLFHYWYEFPGGRVSNVGIAGPVTHAFQSDLANLPVDDIYAAFAGWHAEHEEIYEVPMALLNPAQRREADLLERKLDQLEMSSIVPLALTFFLGEIALLAQVEREGIQSCAIADNQEWISFPTSESSNAITPEIVLSIFRGRKLLRTFNH